MALFGGRGWNTGRLEEAGPWGMCQGCCVSPGLLSMPDGFAACHAGIYICSVCHALLPRTGWQQLWANIVPPWSIPVRRWPRCRYKPWYHDLDVTEGLPPLWLITRCVMFIPRWPFPLLHACIIRDHVEGVAPPELCVLSTQSVRES